MLANKMLEFVCNSPIFDTALITRMFRKMVTGQAMPVMMEVLRNVVESLKIHVNVGWYGQENVVTFAGKSIFSVDILISNRMGHHNSINRQLNTQIAYRSFLSSSLLVIRWRKCVYLK